MSDREFTIVFWVTLPLWVITFLLLLIAIGVMK